MKDVRDFPRLDVREIIYRYPELEGMLTTPWSAYLGHCDWYKEKKLLTLARKALDNIYLPSRTIENMIRSDKQKVMVITSDKTGVWYPFTHDKSLKTEEHVFFRSIDEKCPIELLRLDR